MVFDVLVSRGLDDWLQPARFFDLARYTLQPSEDQYRSDFVWFDLTESGRVTAQEALARLPDLG